MLRLAGLIRSWKPDILHSQLAHANLMARLLRPLVRVPVLISTIHSTFDGGRIRLLSYRLTDRLADHTTIISNASARRYLAGGAVPPDRLKGIPNGVDTGPGSGRAAGVRAGLRRELGVGETFVWLAVGLIRDGEEFPTMLAPSPGCSEPPRFGAAAGRPDGPAGDRGAGRLTRHSQ